MSFKESKSTDEGQIPEPPMENLPEYHLNSLRDLQRRLQMSRVGVYNLRESGELKSISIGSRVYVKEKDFKDFINSRSYNN